MAQLSTVRALDPSHTYGMPRRVSPHDLLRRTKRPYREGFLLMSDANKYRREAEECRRNAESAFSPIDREAWLRLAADWAKLAEGAELYGRRSGSSPKNRPRQF